MGKQLLATRQAKLEEPARPALTTQVSMGGRALMAATGFATMVAKPKTETDDVTGHQRRTSIVQHQRELQRGISGRLQTHLAVRLTEPNLATKTPAGMS